MITRVTIDGMRAVHCTRAVYTALNAVDGITHAEVRIGHATIEHDGRATADSLREAISAAGYEVRVILDERRSLPQL